MTARRSDESASGGAFLVVEHGEPNRVRAGRVTATGLLLVGAELSAYLAHPPKGPIGFSVEALVGLGVAVLELGVGGTGELLDDPGAPRGREASGLTDQPQLCRVTGDVVHAFSPVGRKPTVPVLARAARRRSSAAREVLTC